MTKYAGRCIQIGLLLYLLVPSTCENWTLLQAKQREGWSDAESTVRTRSEVTVRYPANLFRHSSSLLPGIPDAKSLSSFSFPLLPRSSTFLVLNAPLPPGNPSSHTNPPPRADRRFDRQQGGHWTGRVGQLAWRRRSKSGNRQRSWSFRSDGVRMRQVWWGAQQQRRPRSAAFPDRGRRCPVCRLQGLDRCIYFAEGRYLLLVSILCDPAQPGHRQRGFP